MAHETALANRAALELLELQPSDHVLEVGFGHGRTLARVAAQVPQGFVAGVDACARMVKMAGRYNRQLIAQGRVELRAGDSESLPYPDGRFDKVYTVHTLYFWPNPVSHLREIARVMKPGARFVLAFRAKDDDVLARYPASVYTFYAEEEVERLLEQAGFREIRLIRRLLTPTKPASFAVTQRPSA